MLTASLPLIEFNCRSAKAAAIRLNRGLGWALVAWPLVQIVLGTRLSFGMWSGLVLFLGHGVLSLWLFGLPKVTGPEARIWLGFRPSGLSERRNFLVSGWRLAFGFAVGLACMLPGAGIWIALLGFYFLLRAPLTLLQHVCQASAWAYRRWRLAKPSAITALATFTWQFYLVVCIWNFAR